MSGIQKTINETIEATNIAVNTAFNKDYQNYEPELQELAFKYNTGAVPDSKFLINMLFSSVEEWKGAQEYDRFDKLIEQVVTNKEHFVRGKDIPYRAFERARQANSILGMDMYIKTIASLAPAAKDAPYEKMLKLLKGGAGSTYGTCFDNQPLFSTSHNFDDASGTQSNLITGTGVTTAQISDDLKTAMSSIMSFHYSVDTGSTEDEDKRMLNRNPRFVVLCDPSLYAKMKDVRTLENIVIDSNGGSQTNSLRNTFEVVHRIVDSANPNAYYLIDVSEANTKPFLIGMEDEGRLITPQDNIDALANLQMLRYGYNQLSFGNAYGAWWKIVKINN